MFLNDVYLGGFIFNSPDTIAPQRHFAKSLFIKPWVVNPVWSIPFFSFTEVQRVYQIIKLLCAMKKKELNRALEMVVIP